MKTTIGKRKKFLITTCMVLAAVGGLLIGQRWSSASPTGDPNAVVFSGFLEEGGLAVSGKRDVGLQFFDDATGVSAICPETISTVDVTDGYFSVTASSGCVDGLKRQRSAWYRLTVGTTSLPLTRVPTSIFAMRSEDSRGGSRLRPRALVGTDGSRSVSAESWFDSKLAKNCALLPLFNATPEASSCVPEDITGWSVNGVGPTGSSRGQVVETTWDAGVSGGCASSGCTYHFKSDCSDASQIPGTLKAFWSTPFGGGGGPGVVPQYLADQSTQKLYVAKKVFESAGFTTLYISTNGVPGCDGLQLGGFSAPVTISAYSKGAEFKPDWVTFQKQTL